MKYDISKISIKSKLVKKVLKEKVVSKLFL